MPKLLVNRLRPDSIRQFREAARIRNQDAWHLCTSGRETAAIYLWGYVAEMLLKAGWFNLLRYPEDAAISVRDLHSAKNMAVRTYGIAWSGNLHHVLHWAELLVQHRIRMGRRYSGRSIEIEVVGRSRRIHERWRETLRYKTNRPYPAEVRAVSDSAGWLLFNALRL